MDADVVDLGLPGDGQQMQHGVRRPTECVHHLNHGERLVIAIKRQLRVGGERDGGRVCVELWAS